MLFLVSRYDPLKNKGNIMEKGTNASKKASAKAIKHAGNVRVFRPEKPKIEGLTSFEDLIAGYDTAFVKTPSGKMFEIQSVDPGAFLLLLGTPFIALLQSKDANLADAKSVNDTIENLSPDEKNEAASDDNFMEIVKQTVCQGVISVKFMNKPQWQCNADKKELSVNLLPIADLLHLYNAIYELVKPEKLQEMAEFFRSQIKEGKDGTAEDPSDSEDLPSDTESDTLSEDTE